MALYPEEERAKPLPYNAERPLVSSAARVNLGNKTEVEATRQRNSTSAMWQRSSWQCYRRVGEVNYAFNYAASILSRIRFHAAVVVAPDQPPVPVAGATAIKTDESGSTRGIPRGIDPRLAQRAEKYMADLGRGGRMAPMVKTFALNYQVAGECYLACINDVWSIRSTSELKIDAAGYATLQVSQSVASMTPKRLKKSVPIGRIWNQHPEYSADADSSLAAVIDDCEELVLLARLSRVIARSRLNAGLLFVPDDLSAAARTVGENMEEGQEDDIEGAEDETDPFEKELFESMTAPVSSENNAAAIVPLLVRGPADQGDKIKYIQFARDLGESLSKRTEVVLNRVLQGINAPKELTSGLGQTRYNNAQMIDEQSYKALVEPLALVFADAITAIYLQTMLRADIEVQAWAADIDDIQEQISRIVCWYDPSEVVTSVDQSSAAGEGWDRHVLSDEAWRKANGFSNADKPSEEELARRLALAQVAVPPDVIQTLLRIALPEVFKQGQEDNTSQNGVGMPTDLASILQGGGPGPSVSPSPPVPATSVPQDVNV